MATYNSFLVSTDFFEIQGDQLLQITQNNTSRLIQAINTAQEQVNSMISQRYDTAATFLPVLPYSPTTSYLPGARIILDFPSFLTTSSYTAGACAVSNGVAYQSKGGIVPGPFNPTQWTVIGNQYDMFTAAYPYPQFQSDSFYDVGDQVYWTGNIYTALQQSFCEDGFGDIQFDKYSEVPPRNTRPDAKNQSKIGQWSAGTPYALPTNVSPQNASYWVPGDSRNQRLVMVTVDLAIYYLHKSIAPTNIPELRKTSYKEAVKWLDQVNQGQIQANLPELQPIQGTIFRWGGGIARQNHW